MSRLVGTDSIPFVYTKKGSRQVVVLGESNENNVIAEQGVEMGEMLYLSTPESPEKFKLIGEELISVIKEKEKTRKAEELKIQEDAARQNGQRGNMMNITPEMMQQFRNRRGNMQQGEGGRTMDTAAMRRFRNMRNNQQGAPRDTSARRRPNTQTNRQNSGQNAPTSRQPIVQN